MSRTSSVIIVAVACVVLVCAGGCTNIALRSSARLGRVAAPAVQAHWDIDLVGEAMPGNILQLEGLLRGDPDSAFLLMRLTSAYVGYAYGWIEDRAERAEQVEHYEEADHLQRRAKQMYLRARDLGLRRMRLEANGVTQALDGQSDPASVTTWLQQNFDDPEDAGMLFWTASAWGGYIRASKDNFSVAIDLPIVVALIEQSIVLDPNYEHAGALGALGALEASMPGGDLETSRRHFEEALRRNQRKSLNTQLLMARNYAVSVGDRALYTSLLQEVIDAKDPLPAARLSNQIAQRRAVRYLNEVDQFF